MSGSKMILVIDDETGLRDALGMMLKVEGFSVLIGKDGEEGLLLAYDKHPDLIILDMVMPKLDGIHFLSKLRQDPWGKNVPVIVLTNIASKEKEVEIRTYGIKEYMVKVDCSLEDIIEKVKTYV